MDPTDVGINSSNFDTNKMVHTNKKIYFSSLPLPLALTKYMHACLFSPHSKQHVYFPNLCPSFLLGITTTFPYDSHSHLPKCTCCTDHFMNAFVVDTMDILPGELTWYPRNATAGFQR